MRRNNTPEQRWRNVLREVRGLLREADEEKKEEGEDSLDRQVDRYLADYEKEAKSVKSESKDWRRTVKRLLEAGEEKEEDKKEEKPKKLGGEEIDIVSFVDSVNRLVENYDSLLEVRNTILRRAANFIGKNYKPDVVNSFKEALRDNYGFDIGKSAEDITDEQYPAPPAARAGGTGGGA
jgi:uncharacterized protein (UPF0305 family)